VFFQYAYGQTAAPVTLYAFATDQTQAGIGNVFAPRFTDAWHKPGDFTTYPRPHLGSPGYPGTRGFETAGGSSDSYFNASYIRLKNITLRYNLPKTVSNQLHLDNIQLFLTGLNLATWTSWPAA